MKLRRVDRWEELHTTLRVIVRDCAVCGREHGGSLMEKASRYVPTSPTTLDWAVAWIVEPRPPCAAEAARMLGRDAGMPPAEWVLTPVAVAQGRVFVEELDDEIGDVVERKLERVE